MRVRRAAALALLLTFCTAALAYVYETRRWTADVLLHDGRTLVVQRQVQETMKVRIADPFFGLPVAPRTERGGDLHSLTFTHPDTGATVTWQGEERMHPVLLDVVDRKAYLVLLARPSKKYEQAIGCPELPYAFLMYDANTYGGWSPIPAQFAPAVLRLANLEDSGLEERTKHFFQREIPRTYEAWRYPDKLKDEYRNRRLDKDDCRPPPKPLDISLPPPVDLELEAVETVDGTTAGGDQYDKSLLAVVGAATRNNCKDVFALADPANSMAGERFVNDASGASRSPYAGPSPVPSGSWTLPRSTRYCDSKFVWYVARWEERGKIWVTKYTSAGDLVYNGRIAVPQTADNKLFREFVADSITSEGEYLYFYWRHSLPSPQLGPFAYRMTRFRFREPVEASDRK